MKLRSLLLAFALFCIQNINAQNKAWDNTFGTKGAVKTNLDFIDIGKLMAVQTDEKILTAGLDPDTNSVDKNIFFVKRMNKNGVLDITFGKNGTVKIQTGNNNYTSPINLILQADGKILIISALADNNSDRSTIHRLNTDGSIDKTFGTNGVIETGLDGSGAQLIHATVLSDGSIVATGQIYEDVTQKIGLLIEKYNKNGALDVAFGKSGRFKYFSKDSLNFIGAQIGTQKKDGAYIIYAAVIDVDDNLDTYLMRVDNKGVLDNTFGKAGITVVDELTGDNFPLTMTVLPNDKILALDSRPNAYSTVLQQFLPDGKIDVTFADNSKLELDDLSFIQFLQDFVITNDQKILLSGVVIDINDVQNGLLMKFNSSGKPDKTFGNQGRLDMIYDDQETVFNNLILLKNGKILCNGQTGSIIIDFYTSLFQIDPSLIVSTSNLATDLKNIMLYPNPVLNQATLSIELLSAQSLDIQLFDINGRRVSDFTTTNNTFAAGKNEIPLNLPESLTSGTYFVNIRSQEGVSVVKIVKM